MTDTGTEGHLGDKEEHLPLFRVTPHVLTSSHGTTQRRNGLEVRWTEKGSDSRKKFISFYQLRVYSVFFFDLTLLSVFQEGSVVIDYDDGFGFPSPGQVNKE